MREYHRSVSWLKSIVRIFGLCVLTFDIFIGVCILIVAEIAGILEEIPEHTESRIIEK